MKILIEEHNYPIDTKDIREICGDFGKPVGQGSIKVSGVGYFFNPKISDCVICLPKAVMFANDKVYKAFGKYDPKDIIDSKDDIQAFVREFALTSYRTISTYARLNPESKIVYRLGTTNRDDSKDATLLDVILMLIKFYNENKDYFMYVIKNIHSGYDRVNWKKTISRKTPIIQDGSPIYMEVINRRKQINFDEELMIIFYSILNYVAKHLGFDLRFECNYDLITGAEFESYMEEVGLIRLRAIKYKYFSDKDLQMWNLCYAFFEKTSRISIDAKGEDYMLVSDFDKVFENMMDAMISDRDVHKRLVDQKDGKIVDHIYRFKSPISSIIGDSVETHDHIYYIGDSKYYKPEDEVTGTPLYKQHTYARNAIQFHIDLINAGKHDEINKLGVKYRDDITEGYNFIPNFFIGAYIPNDLSYKGTDISRQSIAAKDAFTYHFPDRLFDRDTLFLEHFNVNLLYLMKLYADDDRYEQDAFRTTFRQKVHDNFTKMLEERYQFFWVTPPPGVSVIDFVKANFYSLNGRAYIPEGVEGRFLIAFEKGAKNWMEVLSTLSIDGSVSINEIEKHNKASL